MRAGKRTFGVRATRHLGGIVRLTVSHDDWGPNRSPAPLDYGPESGEVTLGEDLAIALDAVRGVPGAAFGVCGDAHLWQFDLGPEPRFFGMGEKFLGVTELSGYRVRFWNTDVWSDHPAEQWGGSPIDPPYFTTPYVVCRTANGWVGILLHSPAPAFMETPGIDESRVFVEWQRTAPHLVIGADSGEADLAIVPGASLAEVTAKLQRLVGTTPLPPLWSLGYHQSRWGYGGHDDLLKLDAEFAKHEIPCDGLWMDLDYMEGYRVFTTSETAFPGGAEITARELAKNGRRIVPIIDPGVKREPGYRTYDDGRENGVFCLNPEGEPFVGMVWPGETVFPDFSLPEARDWWAGYARRFREEGFGACWIDMNDPSTGPVDPTAMRFRRGEDDHGSFRNAYGLGMAMATQQGFLAAEPDERPFILSRSGFVGTSRYSAIWTGDNLSNRFYLRNSIPTSLGLAISGVPFNGPDLLGFGGDCSDDLAVDWVKAGFLFPFLRNHCGRGQRDQEPFAFPPAVTEVFRRYVRLRYKLLPTLYSLFAAQEERGEAILAPLNLHFDDPALDRIADQFMVGPFLLQAPFLDEKAKTRTVVLPGTAPWLDASTGETVPAGEHVAKNGRLSTPLYLRAGAILAMQPGTPTQAASTVDLRRVQLHLVVPEGWDGESETEVVADDGLTFAYRRGERSRLRVRIAAADGHVALVTEETAEGYGHFELSVVLHGPVKSLRWNGAATELRTERAVLAGTPMKVSVAG